MELHQQRIRRSPIFECVPSNQPMPRIESDAPPQTIQIPASSLEFGNIDLLTSHRKNVIPPQLKIDSGPDIQQIHPFYCHPSISSED